MYVDRCAYCECRLTDANRTIDHVLPVSRGGTDDIANLVLSCLDCNQLKGDRTPRELGWHVYRVRRLEHLDPIDVLGVGRPKPIGVPTQ